MSQWHHPLLRSPSAWGLTRGEHSTVVIVDDGLQYDHPDLDVDIGRSFGWNVQTGEREASAEAADSRHGTSCAGVAAATANNGRGGCGVSHGSTLVGVRLLSSGPGGGHTESTTADDIFVRTLSEFAGSPQTVLSNSWGPPDDGRVDGPGMRDAYASMDQAMRDYGREARSDPGLRGGQRRAARQRERRRLRVARLDHRGGCCGRRRAQDSLLGAGGVPPGGGPVGRRLERGDHRRHGARGRVLRRERHLRLRRNLRRHADGGGGGGAHALRE